MIKIHMKRRICNGKTINDNKDIQRRCLLFQRSARFKQPKEDEELEETNDIHDDQFFLALANWADEWAYDNNIAYGDEHTGTNDMADEFGEFGIDSKEKAIKWIHDDVRRREEFSAEANVESAEYITVDRLRKLSGLSK